MVTSDRAGPSCEVGLRGSSPASTALKLASSAIGLSEPNPRVGCVITSPDQVGWWATGHTQQAGGPHAEVMALRAVRDAGHDPHGATAWVTLEPCAHHGRTPPCCDALITAGLGRVVVALQDPNPLVAGQGIARMRAAGIEVQVAGEFTGALAARFAADHPEDTEGQAWAREAFELNIGFFSRMVRQRPWVRMKIAASLDGQTALANGASQWITSAAARADGHAWRRRAGAVLTGIGTVRDDDPRLDVRLVPTHQQPLRVVVDSRLEISPQARILHPPGQVLVYVGATVDAAAAPLRDLYPNLEVVRVSADERGKTDLAAVLDDLAARGMNELHVEAGQQLNGSLLKAGLVDELLVYFAPQMLGAGRGMAAFGPLERLTDALALEFIECTPIGPDLRIRARHPGRSAFFKGLPTPKAPSTLAP
ncbi:MAG: bifunctional diaminohydroxyphosphoribosylaminopyrimidine deaminase/5-amino-6-(5-phosphoribosylamino)uracil reductase RibD [Betaproteobacteria bacterium]|jgi:diaminohydroxyphosphoribosylaminopyrimidine deaminase/5-amino-6-(5-phosphoribosylamino)uracil reductase